MTEQKAIFQEAMDYIAGSCLISPQQALETVHEHRGLDEPTELEHMEFSAFLDDMECWECEWCGWWGHPGEPCDCDESQEEEEEEEDE